MTDEQKAEFVAKAEARQAARVSQEDVIKEWLLLLHYCQASNINQKEFKEKHDFVARAYGRLSWEKQGEASYVISKEIHKNEPASS